MWESYTDWFSRTEMYWLEHKSAEDLIQAILNSDPIVVLRLLAELMLHGADDKLAALMANPGVAARWLDYESDPAGSDLLDDTYADDLRERFP